MAVVNHFFKQKAHISIDQKAFLACESIRKKTKFRPGAQFKGANRLR